MNHCRRPPNLVGVYAKGTSSSMLMRAPCEFVVQRV
jgi:hypothetical protein